MVIASLLWQRRWQCASTDGGLLLDWFLGLVNFRLCGEVFLLVNPQSASRTFPQKHGRLARLERFAVLPVSSLAHLAASASGGASVRSPSETWSSCSLGALRNSPCFFTRAPRCFRLQRRFGALPLRNMVALLAWSASQFSLFLHSRTSLLPPPASITRRTAKRLL